jgi:hypothetical protein
MLEGNSMTIDDLNRVEGRLGVKLPERYREFMLKYPQSLQETKLELSWIQEPISDRYFRNNAEAIISLNEDVRLPGTPWMEDDGPWPDRFFVIGDDQCGNYYAVDLDSDGHGIWFYDHDIGEFARQHDTLEEFEKCLVKEIEELNRELRHLRPRSLS